MTHVFLFAVLFIFLVRRWRRFEAIMIDQEGRTIADKKNVEYVAREDRLNGADASCGQPTDTPKRADAITFAELVCEVCHRHPLA